MDQGDDGFDGGGLVTGIGDFPGADGYRECDDEAKEVLSGIGVMEVADVVGGVDFLGRDLEVVGRRDGEDLLRLRHRGKNYGLGVGVGRDVYRRGSDGTVDRRRGDSGVRWWRKSGGAAAFDAFGGGA